MKIFLKELLENILVSAIIIIAFYISVGLIIGFIKFSFSWVPKILTWESFRVYIACTVISGAIVTIKDWLKRG